MNVLPFCAGLHFTKHCDVLSLPDTTLTLPAPASQKGTLSSVTCHLSGYSEMELPHKPRSLSPNLHVSGTHPVHTRGSGRQRPAVPGGPAWPCQSDEACPGVPPNQGCFPALTVTTPLPRMPKKYTMNLHKVLNTHFKNHIFTFPFG